mmetsp:Transcript_19133/g.37874  ORF Transcript_19133/g.37874 Transcript_19133/m.37874 type:complete len:372 (-) Transcript_19133:101-1216(-)
MPTDALCGSLITPRRSFLALAWTLTTFLSFFSFGVAVFLASRINQQYNSMMTEDYAEWYYDEYGREYNGKNWDNCRYLEGGEGGQQNHGEQQEGGEGEQHEKEGCEHHDDRAEFDANFFASLATTNSRSLEFAGVYTTVLGIALCLYGSTVVVGFMSLKGEYIPPCFSFRSMSMNQDEDDMGMEDSITGPKKLWGEKIHRGIFLGFLVIFSNLLLLCAVVFGEVQVHDNYNNYNQQKQNNIFSYRIERISSIFAITCIVLAFVYLLFAVIYLSCGGVSSDIDDLIDSADGDHWINNQYEMSNQSNSRRRSYRGRRGMSNAMDKSEPLVGTTLTNGGIRDNEGFFTEISTSSGSSLGSNRWERGGQFLGQLS